jgi:hypothetical protein
MGSAPGHPFLRRVLDHLQRYGHTWILPYLTVMLSTGPLFLSVMWKEYLGSRSRHGEEIGILMPDWYLLPFLANSGMRRMKHGSFHPSGDHHGIKRM